MSLINLSLNMKSMKQINTTKSFNNKVHQNVNIQLFLKTENKSIISLDQDLKVLSSIMFMAVITANIQ